MALVSMKLFDRSEFYVFIGVLVIVATRKWAPDLMDVELGKQLIVAGLVYCFGRLTSEGKALNPKTLAALPGNLIRAAVNKKED